MQYSTLSNGVKVPMVGFGTWKPEGREDVNANEMALEAGYRYFDTASYYGTEASIGQAIKNSGIPREELFLTSKVAKSEMGYEGTKKAFAQSLERLQTDYLDLYLIHWPKDQADNPDWKQLDLDTWKVMEELYEEGKIKAIGVSNFLPHHIENILNNCKIKPMVNQIEFHPGYTQEATVSYCQERGILVQAWSPMGRMRVLQEPLVVELAQKYQVSPAKICLRYALQRGITILPKSSSLERMKQNLDVFCFEISQEDMYRISCMPQAGWSGLHPDL